MSESELLWLNSGWGMTFSAFPKPQFIKDCSWQITFNEALECKLRQNKFPPDGYSKFLLKPQSKGAKRPANSSSSLPFTILLLPWFFFIFMFQGDDGCLLPWSGGTTLRIKSHHLLHDRSWHSWFFVCLISPLLCLAVLCFACAMSAYTHIRYKESLKIQMILGQLLIITFFPPLSVVKILFLALCW